MNNMSLKAMIVEFEIVSLSCQPSWNIPIHHYSLTDKNHIKIMLDGTVPSSIPPPPTNTENEINKLRNTPSDTVIGGKNNDSNDDFNGDSNNDFNNDFNDDFNNVFNNDSHTDSISIMILISISIPMSIMISIMISIMTRY